MSQKRKSVTNVKKNSLDSPNQFFSSVPKLFVAFALVAALVLTLLQIRNPQDVRQKAQTANPQPVGQTGGGWDLVFDEEFNGTSVDTNKWSFISSAESTCTGDGKSLDSGCSNPANQQLEFNWGRNCTVANGILTITAKKESAGGRQWTSCMLHSRPKFQTMYMEARVKMPSVNGFWPGFWTWEGPSNEIDVYEYYTQAKQFSMTNHAGSGGCGPKGNFDPTDGYHVYAADIYQGGARFYIDGVEQCNSTGSPKAPVSILLDMFVHDRQTQAADIATLQTDYIRAWQKGATVPTVAAAPTSAASNTPTPQDPTPTFACLGGCPTNVPVETPEPTTPDVLPSDIPDTDPGTGQLPSGGGGGSLDFLQQLLNLISEFFKGIF